MHSRFAVAVHCVVANPSQVAGELKKMTAFIRQEAMEKAKEIQIKADEEFAIEKSKLVRAETAAIDTSYEKKFKQASMSQQIAKSTIANRSRLRVLSARQDLLDDLFEESRKKLGSLAKDKKKYPKLLEGLILEGLYPMNESKVQVRARKADYDAVKTAAEAAAKEYKSKTGKDISVTIDESSPLPAGV
jgi:V-type H+-transporting ATPase subunit E